METNDDLGGACALDRKIDSLASERHNHSNNREVNRGGQTEIYVEKRERAKKKLGESAN
jgi:hypothetical protein